MVPKHFMAIDEIPLSSNGKAQREVLPSPLDAEAQGRASAIGGSLVEKVDPSSEMESDIRDIFAKVLRIDASVICCRHSTFLDLGGNSFSSIRLMFALREMFGRSIGVQNLFRLPTVAGVLSRIAPSEEGAEGAARAPSSPIDFVQLNKGTTADTVPLIVFNPAGASSLW